MEKTKPQSLIKSIYSATLDGTTAKEIVVEASFTRGLPTLTIVGLADEAIKEAKDRIKSALLLSGFEFPTLRVTINLYPSDLRKSGSQMDLAMALLIAMQNTGADFEDFYCFGELGLDGTVRPTPNTFALVLLLAKENRLKRVVCDKESAELIAQIPNVIVYPVATLIEAIELFKEAQKPLPYAVAEIKAKSLNIADKKFYYEDIDGLDFADVFGQVLAKRAALIAASGFHNIIFSGAPGCGKSMIIKRMREILPPVTLSELLSLAAAQSLDGFLPTFSAKRPFRSPHHTATSASIFGGGSKNAKMGEVALASGGVLFFDELPHFPKAVLEALREPLEDHKMLISRVNSKIVYDTKFLFAAAMNPCPCGNQFSKTRECRCTPIEISRYQNRLSDPFLDRVDLFVQMGDSDLTQKSQVSSKTMQEQVFAAFAMQQSRDQSDFNGKLDDKESEKFCAMQPDAENLLVEASSRFGLSLRSVGKVRRVARTVADLEQSQQITKPHLLEALSFRKR